MHILDFSGPLVIFIQAVALALVAGALFIIVHALGRKRDRWRHPWMRWIWVALAAAYVLVLAIAVIWRPDWAITGVGIGFVVMLVVEVTYLLRVVFPPSRGKPCPPEAPPTTSEPSPMSAEKDEAVLGTPFAPDAARPDDRSSDTTEE